MKKIILLLGVIIISISAAYAIPSFRTTLNLRYSYDTNIFSNPLPMYDVPIDGHYDWLEWKAENPYISKHSLGADFTFDCLFNEYDRMGLSAQINLTFPLKAKSLTPEPETNKGFDGPWQYVEKDITESQKPAVFASIGPIFITQMKYADLGIALRLSMGAYDYIENEFILGLQAEPFVNIYVSDTIYVSTRFTYDAHLMRFVDRETDIFDLNYQMISLAASLGIGFKF